MPTSTPLIEPKAMAQFPSKLLIVGAGFSWNAGLPLASQFTQQLINVDKLNIFV